MATATATPRTERVDELRAIIEAAKRQHGTAQDFVLTAVREAVLTGIFGPGARLRQEELAELFGTSRIPVREALRALEYEGLVTSEPHRGFTVTALDMEDVEEVYDLRVLLEGEAVRLAIPLLTNEDIAELDGLFSSMTASDDPDEQLAARERFYLRLFAVAGRPRLLSLIVRLRQEVARALRWPTIQYSPSHHQQLFEAVKDGDADRAVAQLAAHYRRVALLIRRYLREGDMRQRVVTPIDAPRVSGPHRPAGGPTTRARL
jgi:DNA-binding GntR family transcriptional regulator